LTLKPPALDASPPALDAQISRLARNVSHISKVLSRVLHARTNTFYRSLSPLVSKGQQLIGSVFLRAGARFARDNELI
jgi:hypothetical protein